MRETNKYTRRKWENKKKPHLTDSEGGKRKQIVKPSKYRKQELDSSIEEYYRNRQ